jgi:uncharacterized BrkB/YihY/UPF0761 family membrane protein
MNCPNCGLINPEGAPWCDCGYIFASRRVNAELKLAVPSTCWRDHLRSGLWKFAMSLLAVFTALATMAVALAASFAVEFFRQMTQGSPFPRPDWGTLAHRFVLLVGGLLACALLFIVSRPVKRHRRTGQAR